MNILITGGAGYIGSNVALLLLDKGYKVTIVDNLLTGSKEIIPLKANFLNSDISDKQKISELFKKNKFDVVMHFAGLVKVEESFKFPEKYNLSELKPLISFVASPRGSINLALAAKCYAFINRRGFVIPDDVRAVVFDVLQHRIGISYEAEAENMSSVDIITRIVNEIAVP